MAKERPRSPHARLFIALDLPDELRAGLEEWGARELTDPALRPLAAGSLHVTLAFLGHRPEREIERLGRVLEEIDAPAAEIGLGDPVARPERGRPRLYALPIESPGLREVQETLERRLVAERLHEAEGRGFWPHLTVARVRPEARGSRRPGRVEKPPGSLPQDLLQTTRCVRVRLYRSVLQSRGATYIPLAQVELSDDGRQ